MCREQQQQEQQAAAASPADEVLMKFWLLGARSLSNARFRKTVSFRFRVEAAARLAQAAARANPNVQPVIFGPAPLQAPLLQHIAVQNCFRECGSASFGLGSFGSSLDGGGADWGERCGSRSTLRGGQWRIARG